MIYHKQHTHREGFFCNFMAKDGYALDCEQETPKIHKLRLGHFHAYYLCQTCFDKAKIEFQTEMIKAVFAYNRLREELPENYDFLRSEIDKYIIEHIGKKSIINITKGIISKYSVDISQQTIRVRCDKLGVKWRESK
jgi:hypothetical protein